MPKKKAAAKSKKKSGSKKRTAAKVSRKRLASGKSKKRASAASAKKAPARKSAKKAASNKKAPSKKKPSSKKKPARKAAAKKTSRPVSKKGASSKKASKQASAKKGSTKKTVASKKPAGTAKTTPRKAARPKSSGRPAPASRGPVGATKVNVFTGPSRGFKPYQPKRGEEYMSPGQLEHFRQILLAWKRELMEEVDRTMLHMKDDAANFPDPNDRATQESEFGLELRTRDRERKLLKKIESALGRIEDGSYGYCEETGDEIGLRRLEARPVATLCVEAQERRELAERQFRDREDYYR